MATIKIKKTSKMKTIDFREDKIYAIRQKIRDLVNKAFDDWGCVNDADLDEIEDDIRNLPNC